MVAIGLFGGALVVLHLFQIVTLGYAVVGGALLVLSAYVEYRYRALMLVLASNILGVLYSALIAEKE